jgi:hypothetical protein
MSRFLVHEWPDDDLFRELVVGILAAYPKSGFTRDAERSIKEICDTHSRVVQ